jgi:uncharacterized membrane protein
VSSAWAWVTLATAVGCAVVAGVFFAFSAFVMAGLDRLPASQSVATMQSLNRTALRPPLMIALVGVAVVCAGLAVWALRSLGDRRAVLTLAGAAAYLVGAIGVTRAANVPLNDELDRVDATSPAAAGAWDHYFGTWMAWNHVRGLLCAVGAALLTVALARE